mgnify:CR=1 FL=1
MAAVVLADGVSERYLTQCCMMGFFEFMLYILWVLLSLWVYFMGFIKYNVLFKYVIFYYYSALCLYIYRYIYYYTILTSIYIYNTYNTEFFLLAQ